MRTSGTLILKVPWGYIAAKTWGDTKQTPVLLVHGLLDNAGAFDRLIAQLPTNMYYVCIDLPGHGLSSDFPSGVALDYLAYVLAIRYILDALKWECAYYIGHSFGAHLGLLFTILYPDKIQKLVLIDGVIAKACSNEEIISRIKSEHNTAIETYKQPNRRYYTKDEVIYGLKNLRNCSLNTAAAEAIFERSVTKADDDSYFYNRDPRAKIFITPIFNLDQHLYLIKHLTVETLIITVTDTLPFMKEFLVKSCITLKKLNHVKIIKVQGNHDIHNNYPEKISGYISSFLNHIPSKL